MSTELPSWDVARGSAPQARRIATDSLSPRQAAHMRGIRPRNQRRRLRRRRWRGSGEIDRGPAQDDEVDLAEVPLTEDIVAFEDWEEGFHAFLNSGNEVIFVKGIERRSSIDQYRSTDRQWVLLLTCCYNPGNTCRHLAQSTE